ncbi:hypothetical protein [Mycobacterium sp.]|uniref:hypothetical protein n=1 Tax=Mycobacterium sp. TaxID=1785 RepID=UPI0031CF0D55
MRTAIILAAAAAIAFAPTAAADPGCFDSSDPTCGGHSWNGPLQQTWDTPGFYGGNTGGDPVLCSPLTYQCSGAVPTR